MPIERVNIQTTDFHIRAVNIRGGQLNTIVNALRSSAAHASQGAARLGAGDRTGPGAIESPAARFPRAAPSSGAGSAGQANGAEDPTRGFAPGGDDQLRSLDTNGMLRMIMELLERLLQAILQLVGQGAGGAGEGGEGCGAGGNGASGGPSSCGAGGGGAGGGAAPSGPSSGPTSGPGPNEGSGAGGTCATPPRNPVAENDDPTQARRARARPKGPSMARRILGQVGRGAAMAAPALVPGGPAIQAGAGIATRLAGGGGGGSFEDRIFAFMTSRVRSLEGELDTAMQQADGAKGESSTLATQKVQQLVQKRSEAIEALTNTLKTLQDSTQAVNRNIKS